MKEKKKVSILGIIAFIFSIMCCTGFIGIILAIIDLCTSGKKKNVGFSIAALIIGFITFPISLPMWLGFLGGAGNSQSTTVTETTTEQVTENSEEIEETTEITVPSIEEFKESAESPEYDDLCHYPDKYKTVMLKLTVHVDRIDKPSLANLWEAQYWCTYNGQTIIFQDLRENQEPTPLVGDNIIIYGYGDGVTTLTTKEINQYGTKVNEETDYAPRINVHHLELQ